MKIKGILLFLVLAVSSTFFKCTFSGKKEEIVGVEGYIEDDLGNRLEGVSISYKGVLTSVQTDSLGDFLIDTPRTIYIEFKKDGYQTLATKIDNFSKEGSYNLETVVLKKMDTKEVAYQDIYFNMNPEKQSLKLSGNVRTIFNKPIKNAKITLIDSVKHTTESDYYESNRGFFSFRKYTNNLTFEKKGFRNLEIDMYTYEENTPNVRLLEKSNRKGVYLIKSGKYIRLPRTKLLKKSEEKIGSILWGGNFGYKITDFFCPKKIKIFKIEKDTLLRFAIFESGCNRSLFKATKDTGYLCTIDYKHSLGSLASGKAVDVKTIYPSEHSRGTYNEPRIIEFKPDSTGAHYVFVNRENKKGYYFTY